MVLVFVQQLKRNGYKHIELLSAKTLQTEFYAKSDGHGTQCEYGGVPALAEIACKFPQRSIDLIAIGVVWSQHI